MFNFTQNKKHIIIRLNFVRFSNSIYIIFNNIGKRYKNQANFVSFTFKTLDTPWPIRRYISPRCAECFHSNRRQYYGQVLLPLIFSRQRFMKFCSSVKPTKCTRNCIKRLQVKLSYVFSLSLNLFYSVVKDTIRIALDDLFDGITIILSATSSIYKEYTAPV